jgi:hemolysin III
MESVRHWTQSEEIANAVTHGVGLAASGAGLAVLILTTLDRRDPWALASCSVYGVTLVLLYLTSTLYHSLSKTRARHVLQVLDHSAIFLLIAGTYTPFLLVNLRGFWGWTLFGFQWGLAALGIVFKAVFGPRWPIASTAVYILMGWSAVVAARPLVQHVAPAGIAWLAAGGLAYTLGVTFYAWERLRYGHMVWHLFVLAGSVCHYLSVLWYVKAPA